MLRGVFGDVEDGGEAVCEEEPLEVEELCGLDEGADLRGGEVGGLEEFGGAEGCY